MNQTHSHKRILHFVDDLALGGAERVLVQLATKVDPTRFESLVACFRQTAFADELAAAHCPLHLLEKRRAFDTALLWRLARLLRRERVALLDCHDIQSATYGALAGLLARVPALYTVHGAVVFSMPRARWLLPVLGRLCRRLVFVARCLQDVAVRDFRVPARRACVIYNSADLASFKPRPRDPELARALGLECPGPVVGSVGNLRPVKNHALLIRAFARVRSAFPDATLAIVGEGPLQAQLRSLAESLGLGHSVVLPGPRRDVPAILPLFDVFAVSSDSEGLSLAIVEAMACELPVVATRVGGNPEVVTDGETGILVPPGDEVALGDAIAGLLADPERRRAMGQAARRRATELFSLQRMVRAYEALYDEVLSGR